MSREKQIEEMAKCCPFLKDGKCQGDTPLELDCDLMCKMFGFITNLIQEGYRKQSEGEWIDKHCSICGEEEPYTKRGNAFATTFYQFRTKYCPNCGAKMKGGAE